jgi:hypothetical protein
LYALKGLSLSYFNFLSIVIIPKGTITMFNIEYVISGFRRSVSEVFTFPRYCAASIGSYGRFGVLFEDGANRLSRNVGNLTSTLHNIPPKKQTQHLTFFSNLGVHPEEYFNQTYIFFCLHKKETCGAG